MIESVNNARVKAARALGRTRRRRRDGLCLLEGVRLIETAFAAGAPITEAFVDPTVKTTDRGRKLVKKLRLAGVPTVSVSERVLSSIAATETPQGIVAIGKMREAELDAFDGVTALLICDRIRDPGNMGTIVRTAAATGTALWTTLGSTDVYDAKALRAAAGTTFLIAHRQRLSGTEVVDNARRLGVRLYVADASGSVRYDAVDWRHPFALVVGNEAHGVDNFFMEAADAVVHLPLRAGVESLNAAMTVAVCLFEVVRQRDGADGDAPSVCL